MIRTTMLAIVAVLALQPQDSLANHISEQQAIRAFLSHDFRLDLLEAENADQQTTIDALDAENADQQAQIDDLMGILKIKILRDPDFSHHGVWAWRRTRQELKDAGFRTEEVGGTALDIIFLNSFLSRHPRIIIPVHLLNLAMDFIPFGRRLKFQTIVRCSPC